MRSPRSTTPAVDVMGLPISVGSWGEILAEIDSAIQANSPSHYVSITNTESIYHAQRLPAHRDSFAEPTSLCATASVSVSSVARTA